MTKLSCPICFMKEGHKLDCQNAGYVDQQERAVWFHQRAKVEALTWIPVSERLPEVGASVLCSYTGVYNYRVAVFWKDAGGNVHFTCNEKGSQPVTHWMPLPAPPSEEQPK